MRRALAQALVATLLASTAACAVGARSDNAGAGGGTGSGAGSGGGAGAGGAGGAAFAPDAGGTTCGHGLDLAGCACKPGAKRKCFVGDPKQAGVGVCVWGSQTCNDTGQEVVSGTWSECAGSGTPAPEVCDGVDNDCDGKVDDGCMCAPPTVGITGLAPALACGTTTAKATLTFDEKVTGVSAGATVVVSGGATLGPVSGGPTTYTVDLGGLAPGGAYTLSVVPAGGGSTIENDCRAPLAAAQKAAFSVAAAVAPTVKVTAMTPLACGVVSTTATLTFDQPVTGVAPNDTVTVSGGATITSLTGGPAVYTVDLDGLVTGGSYDLSVLPVGPSSSVESVGCAVSLAGPVSAPFVEGTGGVALGFNPGPSFQFATTLVGSTAQQVVTVTPAGGGVASNVTATLAAPFGFLGGAYPGAGGTCGATIGAPCTVVVTFTPQDLCAFAGQLALAYDSCGPQQAALSLTGSTKTAGAPTSCVTQGFLYVSPSGSDANAGTSKLLPKKTLGAALAAALPGTEIHATAGTYSETLVASGCVKLFGGWDPTFSTQDPSLYVSTIFADVPAGGAVLSFPSAQLHLDGFTVTNPAADGYALYYYQGSSVISHNVISAGGSGMYFWQHTCGAIHDNVISGGTTAMTFWQSGVPVYANQVTSPKLAVQTWQNQGLVFSGNEVTGGTEAIQTWQEEGIVFDGNRFSGASTGIDGWQSTGVVYRNNYVYGAGTALSESSNLVTVANNTVASPGVGLSVGANDYTVTNNLFFAEAGGATGIQASSLPSSIQNNLFLGITTLLSGNVTVTTASALNLLDGTSLPNVPAGCSPGVSCDTARVGSNFTTALAPGAVFVSPDGADAQLATLGDDDWHLATNDPTITQGGKDATLNDCGSHEQPLACGAVTVDYDGAARSVPFSVGAYRK